MMSENKIMRPKTSQNPVRFNRALKTKLNLKPQIPISISKALISGWLDVQLRQLGLFWLLTRARCSTRPYESLRQ